MDIVEEEIQKTESQIKELQTYLRRLHNINDDKDLQQIITNKLAHKYSMKKKKRMGLLKKHEQHFNEQLNLDYQIELEDFQAKYCN